MNTILNRHRLVRWIARILHQLRREFPLATAAREAGVAHGSAVPRWASRPNVGLRPAVEQTLNQPHATGLPTSGSPQESALCPAYVQLAVWRQMWGLHNKERAREINPLTSANSPPRDNDPFKEPHTSARAALTWRAPPGGPRRPPGRRRIDTSTYPCVSPPGSEPVDIRARAWAPCGAGRSPALRAPTRVRQRRKLQSRRGTAAQGDACGSVNCKNRRMTRPTNARVSS